LAAAVALALPLTVECAIVNLDFTGASNFLGGQGQPEPVQPTYVGQGAAGGGDYFNDLLVDSRLPGGVVGDFTNGNFELTVTITNMLDSYTNATTVGFTASPVGGDNDEPTTVATSEAALYGAYLLVGYPPQPSDLTAAFTVSGLGEAPFVDLYFYLRNPATVAVNGSALASFAGSGIFASANTAYFHQLPVSGGQVTGTFLSGAVVSGLTVVTPKPGPVVLSLSPTGSAVPTNPVVEVQVADYITQVAPNSIELLFNGQAVSPVITKPAGTNVTTITYVPGALSPDSANTVELIFSDTSSPPVFQTNVFSFVTVNAAASGTVNIDFQGFRTGETENPAFVGQGAGGGGTVFNGLAADSANPNTGANDDALTVGLTNLVNSVGGPTTESFTISPVGGENVGATTDPTAIDSLLNNSVFVGYFGASGSADFSIGGLNGPAVDLYFYLGAGSYQGPTAAYQPISVSGGAPTLFAGSGNFTSANTVFFSHVPVTGGSVSGTLGDSNGDYIRLSGLSIVTPLPEPYVSAVSPTGGGVPTNAVIAITLQDYVTQVVPSSIQLLVNGTAVVPNISKPAGSKVTTVSYAPNGGWQSGSSNTVAFVFSDDASPPDVVRNGFGFGVIKLLPGAPLAIGLHFYSGGAGGITSYGAGSAMQPGDSAGIVETLDWNQIPGATVAVAGLVDSTGETTPAGLSISTTPPNSFELEGQVPNTAPPGGDAEMMSSHIFVGSGVTLDIAISGLSAAFTAPGYDVYVYWRSTTGSWPQSYAILDDSGATNQGPVVVGNVIGFDGTYVESEGNGSAGSYYCFTNLNLTDFTLQAVPVTPPTSYAFLQGLQIVARGTGAAYISTPPQSLTGITGQPVTFSVVAGGVSPIYYQWLMNSAPIQGATNSSYTISKVGTNDANAQFSVVVSNSVGSVTSSSALLTVEAAALSSAQTAAPGTIVTVGFAAPFSAATATNASNYTINNGVTVSSVAQLSPDRVELVTSPISAGKAYTLTLNGVTDSAGNPFPANSQISIVVFGAAIGIHFDSDGAGGTMLPGDSAGVIETTNWNQVAGATLAVTGLGDSTGAATPANLSISTVTQPAVALEGGVPSTAPGAGDAEMMSSHIYVGNSSSDILDATISGLSAAYTGLGYDVYVYWRSTSGLWPEMFAILDDSGATIAGPVSVTDSMAIGFDGDYVESAGGGAAGSYVVFTGLSLADVTVSTWPAVSGSYAMLQGVQIVSHVLGAPYIVAAPQGQVGVISQPLTLSVVAQGVSPLHFQWLMNGAPIQGATNSSYTIPSVTTNDINAQFSVVVSNSLGTVTSSQALVTGQVNALSSAQTAAPGTIVTVAFAAPFSPATATNASDYVINNGVTVSSATLLSPDRVKLATSPLSAGTAYTLTVNGVQAASAANLFVTNSQISIGVLGAAIGVHFYSDAAGGAMQPGDSAGVIETANWNQVPGGTMSVTGLGDSTGAATPANLSITAQPGLNLEGGVPNTAPAGGDAEMMSSHIYVGPGVTLDVAIKGLSAAFTGPGYDVYVYWRSTSGVWPQSFAILNDSGATNAGPARVTDAAAFDGTYVESDGSGSAASYYCFTNLTLADFTLQDVPVTPPTSYAFMQGVQVVAHAQPLRLNIARAGTQLTISWSATATLQSAASVTGPWKDLAGQTSPYTVTSAGPSMFYRLRQ
jgi:hypothetical protein